MEKLPMCRICLVENVRMYVVVNKNLHELYEKLTDVPFVTEDSRPMLACFFCCTKLKQFYRFLRKCLKAEELFAQVMNEDCETNPLINPEHLEFYNGFVNCPIEHISIVDGCQTESDAIKEELPAAWKRLDKIIDPEEEHQIDELKLEKVDNSCDTPAREHAPLMEIKTEVEYKQESIEFEVENVNNIYSHVKDTPAHHSQSESEDVPLVEIKTEVEDQQESIESELENVDNSHDLKDTSAHHFEANSEDDKSAMAIKIEVEDEQESIGSPVAMRPKLDSRRTKPEYTITAEQKKKETNRKVLFISESIHKTQNCESILETKFKQPLSTIKPRVKTASVTSSCDNSNNHDIRSKISIYKTQLGKKVFKCNICQRSYSNYGNLTRHIRVHTGEKPFKCNECPRSFNQKSVLTNHIRTHTGEKPFKCDICQRGFTKKFSLTNHIRIHTGEKPFKCDICQKTFSKKSNLTCHIRVHNGESTIQL